MKVGKPIVRKYSIRNIILYVRIYSAMLLHCPLRSAEQCNLALLETFPSPIPFARETNGRGAEKGFAAVTIMRFVTETGMTLAHSIVYLVDRGRVARHP